LLVAPDGACPRRKHQQGPPIGFALALPSNSKIRLERVTKGKPSSLLGLAVSDEGKQFYNIDTWCQSYIIFFFATNTDKLSKSVCPLYASSGNSDISEQGQSLSEWNTVQCPSRKDNKQLPLLANIRTYTKKLTVGKH